MALLVTAARADELDLNGSWQLAADSSCGSIIYVVQLAEDVATGALTTTITDCGTVVGSLGLVRISGCSMTPVAGNVSGTTYASPPSGLNTGELLFDPPVADPATGCGSTPVGRITSESRFDATVTDDGMGRGVRIEGPVTVGVTTSYDTNDMVCHVSDYGSLPLCTAVMLRNDVGAGTSVSVEPLTDATVTIDNVAVAGTVTITPLSVPDGALPPNFQLTQLPVYFDVTTTATISGTVEVCLPYPDANDDGFVDGTTPPIDEDVLLLLHEESGEFVNRTTSRDAVNNVICATTESLSQFVFGAATSTCGNGVVDGGEDCDEGAGANGDPTTCCTATCSVRAAGQVCRPDAGECDGTAEACSGSAGACPANVVVASGTPCTDDGNECRHDECDGFGQCGHPPVSAGSPCADDGNACTSDACDGAGACHLAVAAGTSCDDGLACNGLDRCIDGACFHAAANCTPAVALDHYKCHKVKDLQNPAFVPLKDPGMSLADHFGPDPEVDVLKPAMVCNPASKNGSVIADPTAYLCCYKIKGRKITPRRQVEIDDQFGSLQLEAVKAQVLCQLCVETPLNF
jgi:hypothetical protein